MIATELISAPSRWDLDAKIWMLRTETLKIAWKEDWTTDQGMFWHNEQFWLDASRWVKNLITKFDQKQNRENENSQIKHRQRNSVWGPDPNFPLIRLSRPKLPPIRLSRKKLQLIRLYRAILSLIRLSRLRESLIRLTGLNKFWWDYLQTGVQTQLHTMAQTLIRLRSNFSDPSYRWLETIVKQARDFRCRFNICIS